MRLEEVWNRRDVLLSCIMGLGKLYETYKTDERIWAVKHHSTGIEICDQTILK